MWLSTKSKANVEKNKKSNNEKRIDIGQKLRCQRHLLNVKNIYLFKNKVKYSKDGADS